MDCAKKFLLNRKTRQSGKNRQSDYFRRRLAPRNLGRDLASSLQDIGWSGSHVRRH